METLCFLCVGLPVSEVWCEEVRYKGGGTLKLHVMVYLEKTKLIQRTMLADYLEKPD